MVPHLTTSSSSLLSEKLHILSTSSQTWESSISKQEGSTSLEIEDSLENEDKILPTTMSEDLEVSRVSSATTHSPEVSSTSHSSTNSSTTPHQTSGYRIYLDSVTDAYEEASGHEPDTVSATLQEDVKFAPALEGEVSPTPQEEVNISLSLENETKMAPTLALGKEANVSSNLEEEDIVTPTPVFEENSSSAHETVVVPTAVFEEEANLAPTFEDDDEANTSLSLEEEADVLTTVVPEKEPNLSPNISLKEDANTSSTLVEEASVVPMPVLEQANLTTALVTEEEANVSSALEEEAEETQTLEDKTNVRPMSQDEDFTTFPLTSQTSKWELLTTTTGSQESLNDLEHSQKASTSASVSSRGTKPTERTTTTTTTATTTTTHWSRRTWSPTTTTPKVFSPSVGHSLGNVDVSFTQLPTLLKLPNERAAVGGTGKSSGNVNATLISLTVLFLLDTAMH